MNFFLTNDHIVTKEKDGVSNYFVADIAQHYIIQRKKSSSYTMRD